MPAQPAVTTLTGSENVVGPVLQYNVQAPDFTAAYNVTISTFKHSYVVAHDPVQMARDTRAGMASRLNVEVSPLIELSSPYPGGEFSFVDPSTNLDSDLRLFFIDDISIIAGWYGRPGSEADFFFASFAPNP